MVQLFPLIHISNPYWSHIVEGGQHGNYSVQYLYHMGAIWAPLWILKLSLIQDYVSFISGSPHKSIYMYFNSYRILPLWDPYWSYISKKSLYGAHVGPEWAKCPNSARMCPKYTYLLSTNIIIIIIIIIIISIIICSIVVVVVVIIIIIIMVSRLCPSVGLSVYCTSASSFV